MRACHLLWLILLLLGLSAAGDQPKPANRLAKETSPYLLQHAPQPGRLVSVGTESAGQGQAGKEADLPLDRLFELPLVPRDGAGEL